MARRRKAAVDASRFKNEGEIDPDREVIEKASRSAAGAKKPGAGHNSGEVTDDVLNADIDRIEEAQKDFDEVKAILDKKAGILRQAFAMAKKHKCPIDDIKTFIKLKKMGMGEVVTTHRNIHRILMLRNHPLGTQFDLFKVAAAEEENAADATPKAGMDAELQGQHAWSNNEPISNNPFTPGTQEFEDWNTGHNNAMSAAARKMGGGSETAVN